jgi:hypothetical protein
MSHVKKAQPNTSVGGKEKAEEKTKCTTIEGR